jgi:branched-chain amino acid transport system substrate-binding protein
MNPFRPCTRNNHQILLCLILIAALTACGSSPTQTADQATANVVQTGIAATLQGLPTHTEIPTETVIPTPSNTPFVPKATIRIANQGPLTGDLSNYGADVLHAVELAVTQKAGALQQLGYQVELVSYDDQDDIPAAVANAKQIVADPSILCLVGDLTSRILIQTEEIYHQAGLPLITPSATATYITGNGYLEVNRLMGRNDVEGLVGAKFIIEQGYKSVFIISRLGDMALFIADHLRQEVMDQGVVIAGYVQTWDTDFEPYMDALIKSNPDVVYFSSLDINVAGNFFRQARAAGYMGPFLGMSGLDNAGLLEFAGPLLLDGGGMYYSETLAASTAYPGAMQFASDYENAYGIKPGVFSTTAFDATGICLTAIEKAIIANNGELPSRTQVAKEIRALKDYAGISGTYTFNAIGEPESMDYFIYKVASFDANNWSQNTLVTSYSIPAP